MPSSPLRCSRKCESHIDWQEEGKIAQFSLVYDDDGLEVVAGRGRAAVFAQATLDRGVVVNGVLKQPAAFVTTLKRTLHTATPRPITTRHVIVGLPEPRVFTTLVALPHVRKRELAQALTWQLPELLPVPTDELAVDFQPISARRHDERQLLVFAAPITVVGPLIETLESAGLIVDRCVPRSLGIASLFATPIHTPLMVVHHEASDAVSLIIVKNGTTRFSTTVPLDRHHGRVSAAIERAIEFYEARDGQHRRVARVLVLPHPAADELVNQLRVELKLPVQIAETPWSHAHAPRRLRSFLGSLGLLQLRGVRVNLLPPGMRETRRVRATNRRSTLVWLTELTVAAVVVATVTLTILNHLTTLTGQTAALAALPPNDQTLVTQGEALESLATLHQAKQGLRSTRQRDYAAIAAAAQAGVRLLVVEHDPLKRETRVLGERTDRGALARYVATLMTTFPDLSLAPGDWASTDTAPFHLTVKRP